MTFETELNGRQFKITYMYFNGRPPRAVYEPYGTVSLHHEPPDVVMLVTEGGKIARLTPVENRQIRDITIKHHAKRLDKKCSALHTPGQ